MVDLANEHARERAGEQSDSTTDSNTQPGSTAQQGSTRRGFLVGTARGAIVVAAAAAVSGDVYAAHRGVFASGSGPAYAPWQQWQDGAAPLRLVRAGILAANAHNAQAWRFDVTPRSIEVYADTSRGLGTIDPYRREMHLSAGCAIENIVLAAPAAGLAATVRLSGQAGLLATIDLAPGPAAGSAAVSELYRAIPHRHTDRGAYQRDRPLAADVRPAMDALIDAPGVRLLWLADAGQRSAFSAATVAATESFVADRQQSVDDFSWYRGTWQQVQQHRDGVTVDASGLSPLLRTLGKLVPATRSSNDGYWLSGTRDRQLPTASAFALVAVRDATDVAQRLAAGRVYQRLHLWATARGLAMQPLNQIVERAERERVTTGPGPSSRDLAAAVSLSSSSSPAGSAGNTDSTDWQPVMPFRIGYPSSPAPASPRRAIGDVVVVRP